MQVIPIRTPIFENGQELFPFVADQISDFRDGDVVAVTSKIAALAEGRRVSLETKPKKSWIREESDETVETPWCVLTRHGRDWCVAAGVDESNANGQLILLPKDGKAATKRLRSELMQRFALTSLGVILTDTRSVPLRRGTAGMALAWAGLEPFKDYVGTPDLFGRELKMTKANLVHALAAAAVLVMGEGAEQCPIAMIRDAPVTFSETSGTAEDVAVDPNEDLYGFLYRKPSVN